MERGSRDKGPERNRVVAAIIAYLRLLDHDWERLSDDERRSGVRLALEAARRTYDPNET